MAKQEEPREDILREATALVRRIELRLPGEDEHVVIGFRRNDSISIFFGEDPVYQFNAEGELRRGYWHGKLVKAESRKLATLTRVREPGQVSLVRHDLKEAEMGEYIETMTARLENLVAELINQRFEMIGQVPAGENIVVPAIKSINSILANPQIADRPNA